MKTVEERFEEKVDRSEHPRGCVLWTGGVDSFGYGNFWDGARVVKAHRFALEKKQGKLSPGLCALHKCDTPRCVNDEHLYAGTKQQNALDREDRNRGNHPVGDAHHARHIEGYSQGQKNGRAKITEKDVRAMRKAHRNGARGADLAREYKLTKTTVSYILRGKLWSHVTEG